MLIYFHGLLKFSPQAGHQPRGQGFNVILVTQIFQEFQSGRIVWQNFQQGQQLYNIDNVLAYHWCDPGSNPRPSLEINIVHIVNMCMTLRCVCGCPHLQFSASLNPVHIYTVDVQIRQR